MSEELFVKTLSYLDEVEIIGTDALENGGTTNEASEARLVTNNLVLLQLSNVNDQTVAKNFPGTVVNNVSNLPSLSGKTVYVCGDMASLTDINRDLKSAKRVFIISELSMNYEDSTWPVVGLGRVPMDIHGVGIFYRRYFETELDYFNAINSEHEFQSLTESTKPGKAHRTGIYLTKVQSSKDDLRFHLLRCSTNLSGPTGNFRETDTHIIDMLNQESDCLFENHAPLNHVLAQIYWNNPGTANTKPRKARIKMHADKTKDMPGNGIMAFCTFYTELEKLNIMKDDPFDYGFKKGSGMTKLIFRLKKMVADRPDCSLEPYFEIKLYPGSVFFMPLSTNRYYTHEIRPAHLDAEMLPTRMGYVVRCSNTLAVHLEGTTYFDTQNGLVPMEPSDPVGIKELRNMYYQENVTDNYIDYEGKFLFSMNKGDYSAPIYDHSHEFRQYALNLPKNPYEQLYDSVRWEHVTKGRRGTVLVKPHQCNGSIPIVRTTTKYNAAAQVFKPTHIHLAELIQRVSSAPYSFNNALIENYSNEYFKMGFHSDQALDLEEGSHIAVFSCYKYPELTTTLRKLIVECKEPGEKLAKAFEIELKHNSVVVFSVDTNHRFKHKITLDVGRKIPENEWLGVTFRTSKTFVTIGKSGATFADGTPLTLADASQKREFYKLRGRENRETNFQYPDLNYTISESDTMFPL